MKNIEKKDWYHGSSKAISKFSVDFVGDIKSQHGPGIYFSDNYEDACSYMKKESDDGYLYTVKLDLKKMIGKRKPSKATLSRLIGMANNSDKKLSKIDKNIRKAMNSVISDLLKYSESSIEVFIRVWLDFYLDDSPDFCENMVLMGYDGFLVKMKYTSTTHAIVYNPRCITIQN